MYLNHSRLYALALSVFFAGGVLFWAFSTQAMSAGTFTVNSTLDEPDATLDGICSSTPSGVCTLRAAIQEANSYVEADTIILPPGTYYLTRLGSNEDFGATGDLDLFTSLSIVGDDPETTIIDANRFVTGDRAIHVHDQNGIGGVQVNLSGITLQNGTSVTGGGILLEEATLNLDHVIVKNNLAQNASGSTRGGGIENVGGTLSLNFSYVRNNASICSSCPSYGGGIDNINNSLLVIENSYIMDNEAGQIGGGIFNTGTLLVFNSLFWLNQAASQGGALYTNQGAATLVNTTISQNGAGNFGGGIYLQMGAVNIFNNTIVNNDADNNDDGVGSHGGVAVVTGSLTMYNTILANNYGANGASDDCGNSVIHSGGYNLIRTHTNCPIYGDSTGNLYGINPQLDALAGNGGPTLTHALLANSPAIDAGNFTGCIDQTQAFLLDTDQRGYARHVDGGSGTARCDIGAYEYGATPPINPTPTPTNTPTPEEMLPVYLPLIIR